jgi:hypothetical protein
VFANDRIGSGLLPRTGHPESSFRQAAECRGIN